MKNLSVMIKPASSLCNMRCKYCFYADISQKRKSGSFGIMETAVLEQMLARIKAALEPGDCINFVFQGGEPVLAGLKYFRNFTAITELWKNQIQVSYALQTNALCLDKEWCEFLAEHQFLTGVSFDILKECHDKIRIDASGKGTAKRVQKSMRLLEKHAAEYNVLCTLTKEVAGHPIQVWNEIQKNKIRYIQFTPCLADLETSSEENPYALTPEKFSSFYTALFPLWKQALFNGNYISIKLFDDYVNLLAYGRQTACGITGSCQPQLVIEADGSVYPCDFYCLDEYCLGNITREPLSAIWQKAVSSPVGKRKAPAKLCGGCAFKNICGGGCKRMQGEVYCRPGQNFCGMQKFLHSAIDDLLLIARNERKVNSPPALL